ncbi:MAG: DUF1311 domain-containing protein [Clostridiales bacterium]|uniref:lysozyme inhibitor LprI family protein n=1 Tax=Roseburia sp. MSJ-14 TaxID=2841514 RepID=UPI0016BADBFE|nr:lysozyme inhibitor LprI family protein [Roseburia sp. MSJ-14]MBU5474657.1 DUF1311 domain-containing protein [Roseburia sp. MSJ-14]NLK76608.1 DUF1311 domain-containing protein [Clostridiales bacterium]
MMKANKKLRKLMLMLGLSGVLIGTMTACGNKETTQNTSDVKKKDSKEKKTLDNSKKVVKEEEKEEPEETEFSYEDLEDVEFCFTSGAGGWSTTLQVEADGSFSGLYNDSDMGDAGDDYPDGTRYVSQFSGQFGKLKKVNDYTYSAKIESIELEQEPDTEEYADDVKYVYSEPYGIDGAKEILFYLKGAPIDELPEGYLSWVKYNYDIDAETELPFYGLYNEAEENGFVGEDASLYDDNETQDNLSEIDKELEEVEQRAKEIEDRLDQAYAQVDLNEASAEEYELWDDELNQIWARLKETLDEDTMKKLTEEERQWVAEKEAAIKEAGAECEGGSMQPMLENLKGAELTRERVYELADMLK